MNLAVNAREAMPHGGSLTIRTANADLSEGAANADPHISPGRYVVLTVHAEALFPRGCGRESAPTTRFPLSNSSRLRKGRKELSPLPNPDRGCLYRLLRSKLKLPFKTVN